MAVDSVGHLLALHVAPANQQVRDHIERLAERVQEVTQQSVSLANVDLEYTGERAADAAEVHGITLEVTKVQDVKKGFTLLPRRWVVERSIGWLA